jgi:hypothetical protein
MIGDKCRHEACHCREHELQSDGFCSDSCRAHLMDGERCACAHDDCEIMPAPE